MNRDQLFPISCRKKNRNNHIISSKILKKRPFSITGFLFIQREIYNNSLKQLVFRLRKMYFPYIQKYGSQFLAHTMNTGFRKMESENFCMRLSTRNFISNCCIRFILLQLCAISLSFALDPQKAISQYTHLNWQTDDGLPQNAVQCIYQTRDGFLWLGTQEGLVRFDGVTFSIYDRANTPEINHNSIQSITQTADGSLWIGTQGGLTRFIHGKFISFTTANGLVNNNIYDLYEDPQQNLWIATLGGGVSVWNNGKFKTFSMKDGLASNLTTCVTGAKDGSVYIGTTGGVSKYFQGKFSTIKTAEGLASNNVLSLYLDSTNVLWVGTNAGVRRWRNGTWTTFTTNDGLSNNHIRSILVDDNGNVWMGTEGGGLNRMWKSRISSYSTNDGLLDGNVWCVFEDKDRNLWVGTIGGGLHCFRDSKILMYGEKEGLSQDNTRAIYQTRDGVIWIASDNRGLTRFKDGVLTSWTSKFPQATLAARAFTEGTDGSFWVGTYGSGLCRLNNDRWTIYTTKDGLANDRILGLTTTRDNALWIGTRGGGISIFQQGMFRTYSTKDGLLSNEVRIILEGHDGSIWIGTNSGLNRFKDDTFTSYTTADGLSYNLIYSLFEDKDSTLWIGTYGGGLNRLKDGRFTAYTTRQGMYDNTVFQILEDTQQNFWLTCNRGVYRVSKQELNDFAQNKISRVNCSVFGTVDGLRSLKCNGSCQPAGIRSADGRLWIPTLKGVAIIDPNHLTQSKSLPPVFLERMLFDRHTVDMDSLMLIGPGTGELEFHYTALNYSAPKQINFKFMLMGYDQDWADVGTRRVAYYTNIPPGEYTFQVIASNEHDVWNWQGAKVQLQILPHFYQSYWFRGLVILFLGVLIFGLHRYRVWRLLVRERMLKAYVTEAMAKIKVLNGLIPICASCKKIRDDKGYWNQLEEYINEHSEATFSHGVCPDCAEKLYGKYLTQKKGKSGEILSQVISSVVSKDQHPDSSDGAPENRNGSL